MYLEASRPLGGPVGLCKRPGSAGPGAGGLDYDIVPGDPLPYAEAVRRALEERGRDT